MFNEECRSTFTSTFFIYYYFKHLRETKHTHHPVDDAKGNAEALLKMKKQIRLKIKL